jgi:hypothetical protein
MSVFKNLDVSQLPIFVITQKSGTLGKMMRVLKDLTKSKELLMQYRSGRMKLVLEKY